jgi:hypothetical protein
MLSLGNDSPNGLVPHSGNMHDSLLVLALFGCSGWLLGQEDELPSCSVDQVLEGREGVVHQLIVEGINQSSQKAILPLGIRVDIFWA